VHQKNGGVCISPGILFDNCLFEDQTFVYTISGKSGKMPYLFINFQKISESYSPCHPLKDPIKRAEFGFIEKQLSFIP